MQKIKKRILVIIFMVVIWISNISFATQEEILNSQAENLNIKGFVSEANKYTKDVFEGVDASDLINDAIKGEIDNKTLIEKILGLFGKEVTQTLTIVR